MVENPMDAPKPEPAPGAESEPAPAKQTRQCCDLDELVSRITPGNRHDKLDWGRPMGKEIW